MPSYKTSIVEGTKELTEFAQEHLAEATEEAKSAFRKALNTLNPEVRECNNDACPVQTWSGASSTCPACHQEGDGARRSVV